ncbi:MAG: hypothetical protein AAGF77_13665 [Bacteroidota bacterium]
MLKKITLAITVLCIFATTQAQKKKDLLDQIAQLEDSIQTLSTAVSKAQRQVNSSEANAKLFEKENSELRDANATLLKNLSSFSQISKQNTETVNKALASLKAKEGQLQFITDDFSKNDSTAIVILTKAKQTLGPDAKISISDGDVVISNSLDALFGGDTQSVLTESAKAYMTKIGTLIAANPERAVFVEGLNITGEFDLTYKQAYAVQQGLLTAEGVQRESFFLIAKDGNFKEGVNIRLAPKTRDFYKKLRAEFK